MKSIILTHFLILSQLITHLKSNQNVFKNTVEDITPFGTRLSSKNRINYKNLGNFQMRTYPKPQMRTISVPIHRTIHPIQYVDMEPNDIHARPTRPPPAVFEVDPGQTERPPIVFNFKTLSRDVKLTHTYIPAIIPPVSPPSKTEHGPHIIIKEVNIPVIHEVYEYIIPRRYYLREIKPVIQIQNQMIAQSSTPVDIRTISNTLKDERMECFDTNPNLIYDKNLYNGQSPYDYKYNSTRGLMSYYNSDNMLFNVLRKYRD